MIARGAWNRIWRDVTRHRWRITPDYGPYGRPIIAWAIYRHGLRMWSKPTLAEAINYVRRHGW